MTVERPGASVTQVDPAIHSRAERVLRAMRPSIWLHSMRVHAYAVSWTESHLSALDPTELFISAAFHDSGTIPGSTGDRFEVAGADQAVCFARRVGVTGSALTNIWHAVALHTSPGIAERSQPLTRALRAGVVFDLTMPRGPEQFRLKAAIEERFPRLNIELDLAQRVTEDALARPSKAPGGSWPRALVEGNSRLRPDGTNPNF